MHCKIVRLFLIPLLLFVSSCESTPEAQKNTFGAGERGDIMDTSTWDFGEIDVEEVGAPSYSTPTTPTEQFAIVIATFTGPQHNSVANATRNQLAMQYAMFRDVTIRQRSRGSALTFGSYTGYDDPKAKEDIAMLRSIQGTNGRPLFAQVMLMKCKTPQARGKLHPYDLWTIRREFPTLVPIFTLEVAVWGDFDSGVFPKDRRRAAAEGYATELRRKGFEAFFYHNDESELSSVTVGLFGHSAVDAETGFYSPEVDAMMSRFPARLVNGEEVREFFNPRKPELGSTIQRPCLAEVPID